MTSLPTPVPDQEEDDEEFEQPQEHDPSGRFVRVSFLTIVQLAEVLGAGAFKTVYKGVDTEKGTEVAWNKLRPGITEHDFRKLYEEVRLLEHLVHPRIINFVHSWIDSENQLVFITEYMTSGTLKQYLKTAKHVKLKVIKEWCQQILEGLAYLHSHDPPIIHRDIKCDNIFINGATCEVKIGDLGLATVTRKNNSMSVIGTPEFMAPEFYTEHYDSGVDVWAFGLTMLEMITGTCPYAECENIAQIFRKVSSGQLPTKQLERIGDPDIRDFIRLCLSAKESRPTAAQLMEHPFLVEKGDEKSQQTITVLPPQDDVGKPREEGEGHFVIDTLPEAEAKVVLVDAMDLGDNVLQLSLKLHLGNGVEQDISFSFNLESDTAEDVSAEMVKELQLDPAYGPIISRLIHEKVDMFLGPGMMEEMGEEGASGSGEHSGDVVPADGGASGAGAAAGASESAVDGGDSTSPKCEEGSARCEEDIAPPAIDDDEELYKLLPKVASTEAVKTDTDGSPHKDVGPSNGAAEPPRTSEHTNGAVDAADDTATDGTAKKESPPIDPRAIAEDTTDPEELRLLEEYREEQRKLERNYIQRREELQRQRNKGVRDDESTPVREERRDSSPEELLPNGALVSSSEEEGEEGAIKALKGVPGAKVKAEVGAGAGAANGNGGLAARHASPIVAGSGRV